MDAAEFEGLMAEHWATVRAWARKMAGDLDWESLSQDVFLRAWKARERLPRESAPLKVYLYRTLRGVVVDRWRWRGRRLEGSAKQLPLDEAVDRAGREDAPADRLVDAEDADRLLDRIAGYGEPAASILMMFYGLQLQRQEIASALGLSYEQVKSVIRYRTPQLRDARV